MTTSRPICTRGAVATRLVGTIASAAMTPTLESGPSDPVSWWFLFPT